MYFTKIRHPANFNFDAKPPTSHSIQPIGGDAFRIQITREGDWVNPSQAELAESLSGLATHRVAFDTEGTLRVETAAGHLVLSGKRKETFGTCGDAWMLQFHHSPSLQFYGLGEHSSPEIEKTGQRVKFWNTDLWGDFALHDIRNAHPNPMYVAIPWLVVKRGNDYIGILINHPGAVFMDLASNFIWTKTNQVDIARASFFVGAPDGNPDVFIIVGPTLPELTRKLQTLVGRTPRPPLWALGHHQCRWGYAGPADLSHLDAEFTEHEVPTDGLWLDIDYMERYKVFTFDPELWGSRKRVAKLLAQLGRNGRRVVPILDPGVKVESGYEVHDGGLKSGVFCLNPAGRPYVGFVWPGQTYFPDFSRPDVRAWWAAHVKSFAELGVAGAWLDMNDPSVGAVELEDMLFDQGSQPHESYHNQYALGMAKASREGFLAANPDTRPFLLARSAFISSSRYTALWTGDNVSNWHHLKGSVALTLNLAMSGVPFNGPDVAGFGADTTPALAIAWYKAGFLFPFFRNHSMLNTRKQEPWALGANATRIISHYIRLRYKLLPYLYQLFIAQEKTGEAILRPLFYGYADTSRLPLGLIGDQFLIGSDLLQAPVLSEGAVARKVVLPGKSRWFSAQDGNWQVGGSWVETRGTSVETPLYVREGALVPMQVGERTNARNDCGDIELHCFLRCDTDGEHSLEYEFDDGESFGYRKGLRTRLTLRAQVLPNSILGLATEDLDFGYKPLRIRVVAYDDFASISLTHRSKTYDLPLIPHQWSFTGRRPLPCRMTKRLRLS